MIAAILYSGGKDSTRALHWALEQKFDVKYLVTMYPEMEDSWMYHTPALNLVELSSQAVEIPLIKGKSSGVRDQEVEDLKTTLATLDIGCVICGALASAYQKSRVEEICGELELKVYTPFWHHDPEKYVKETIDLGFDIRIVSVSALGFDESWLGRKLDHKALEELKGLHEIYGIHLAGEGGEYESFVCDGPMFKKKIEFVNTRKIWNTKTESGYLAIYTATLSPK